MNRNRYSIAAATAICLIGGVWVFLLQAASMKFRLVRHPLQGAAELSSEMQVKLRIAELLMAYPLAWVLGIFGFSMAVAFLLGVPVVEIPESESDNAN